VGAAWSVVVVDVFCCVTVGGCRATAACSGRVWVPCFGCSLSVMSQRSASSSEFMGLSGLVRPAGGCACVCGCGRWGLLGSWASLFGFLGVALSSLLQSRDFRSVMGVGAVDPGWCLGAKVLVALPKSKSLGGERLLPGVGSPEGVDVDVGSVEVTPM
jgi:hypothetical protein